MWFDIRSEGATPFVEIWYCVNVNKSLEWKEFIDSMRIEGAQLKIFFCARSHVYGFLCFIGVGKGRKLL